MRLDVVEAFGRVGTTRCPIDMGGRCVLGSGHLGVHRYGRLSLGRRQREMLRILFVVASLLPRPRCGNQTVGVLRDLGAYGFVTAFMDAEGLVRWRLSARGREVAVEILEVTLPKRS